MNKINIRRGLNQAVIDNFKYYENWQLCHSDFHDPFCDQLFGFNGFNCKGCPMDFHKNLICNNIPINDYLELIFETVLDYKI